MKKALFILTLIVGMTTNGISQRYAFVNTKDILDKIPAYTEAQKQLDDVSEKWQKEIEEKYQVIEKKYKTYQQEEILLPEETKRQREEEIIQLEQEVKELQQKRFGVDGDLFKKRKQLIAPIQDKIYKAIQQMAKDKGYDFILDTSSNTNILFANPKYDKTDAVLKKIK